MSRWRVAVLVLGNVGWVWTCARCYWLVRLPRKTYTPSL